MKYQFKIRTQNYSCLFALLVLFGLMPVGGASQTAIGGSTPDPSALLDVQSPDKGVLFPRIPNPSTMVRPATGLIIFNTTSNCLEINMGSPDGPSWQPIKCPKGKVATLDCTNLTVAGYLMPNVLASGVSITLNYTGGNGLDYDAASFASTGVTGLTANLAAGTFANGSGSLTLDINGTGVMSGLANFELTIGGQTCTITEPVGCGAKVNATDWKVFSCFNLGSARTTGDPFTPSWDINGAYWQWGKSTQAAPGPTNASTPNAGSVAGWSITLAANNSWVDSDPMPNNPCPTGFRVPTKTDWEGVRDFNVKTDVGTFSGFSGDPNNYGSGRNFGRKLYLPNAGVRSYTNGSLIDRGAAGYYWSSTQSAFLNSTTYAYGLKFEDYNTNYVAETFERTQGFSVRCIAQ